MTQGTIEMYNDQGGWGFVRTMGEPKIKENFFFHISDTKYDDPQKDDRVQFQVVKSTKKPGSLCAIDVELISRP